MNVKALGAVFFLCLLLAACGGGGGSSDGPGNSTYTIGGAISGLDGTVVLQNNGANNLSRSANGNFSFATPLADNSSYNVTISAQPDGQTCTVTNGSGTVSGANVTNVTVTCVDDDPPVDSNASLAALTLSSGALDQIFQAGQFSYTSTQGFLVASIEVTPTAEAAAATVTVNGSPVVSGQPSQPIALAEDDETVVTIVVTAPDGASTRTYTVVITRQSASVFAQQAYVKASNTGALHQFGISVALSGDGNTMAVGAHRENGSATGINGVQDSTLTNAGAVYVFIRDAGVWVQQAYVKASNPGAADEFGSRVALSSDGNTLAVGAREEDSAATGIDGDEDDNSVTASGAVYVFTRTTAGVWSQQAYVKASNPGTGDFFGSSVALSGDGNTLAVGAVGERGPADEALLVSGAVYVFTRTGGDWSQQSLLRGLDDGLGANLLGDVFGSSVALSGDGNTLVIGAPQEDSDVSGIRDIRGEVRLALERPAMSNNDISDSGAVFVYTRTGSDWNPQAYIKASNPGAEDLFGASVTLSADGNTLAVGAPTEDSNATGVGGIQSDNSAIGSGAVYVFTRTEEIWSQQAYVKASNTDAGDQFGFSVSLSDDGSSLVVGATMEDSMATGVNGDQTNNLVSRSGAAYVFTRSDDDWGQQVYVKASNTRGGADFGRSVSLSGDGSTLAVGALTESSDATGIDGDQANFRALGAGAVYVFGGQF